MYAVALDWIVLCVGLVLVIEFIGMYFEAEVQERSAVAVCLRERQKWALTI